MKNECDKNIDWELEAKKHAAEAGELKIAIAEKLDEVKRRILTVTEEIEAIASSSNITAMAAAKTEEYELKRQEQWLEKILYGGTDEEVYGKEVGKMEKCRECFGAAAGDCNSCRWDHEEEFGDEHSVCSLCADGELWERRGEDAGKCRQSNP